MTTMMIWWLDKASSVGGFPLGFSWEIADDVGMVRYNTIPSHSKRAKSKRDYGLCVVCGLVLSIDIVSLQGQ